MGLIAGRDLQDAGLDLQKTLLVKPRPKRFVMAPRASRNGLRSACRAGDHHGESWSFPAIRRPVPADRETGGKRLASTVKISMLRPETASTATGHARPDRPEARNSGKTALKVIASSIRKGNVIEQDGRLYVVLTAENIHPGKGTPVSQIEMRRIGDGVKVSERYKTTDQVEKATVEDRNFNFLYEDADGFHFMNNENYDQVQVSKEIVGIGGAVSAGEHDRSSCRCTT